MQLRGKNEKDLHDHGHAYASHHDGCKETHAIHVDCSFPRISNHVLRSMKHSTLTTLAKLNSSIFAYKPL